MRDIQHKLLPHPLSPFLKPLGMAGGAEPTGAAGKVEKEFSTTAPATNSGKPAPGIAAVQIALHNFFYDRTEIAILPLNATLILREEPAKRMEEDPVEDCVLWMSGTVDSCPGKQRNSRNEPEDCWIP